MKNNWQVNKQVVTSKAGLVASQSYQASKIGADILSQGGNAIDAAIATSFALGVAEPWMSGIGGGGYMVYRAAGEKQASVIEFGMRSPQNLKLEDYPLDEGVGGDLFAWPAVKDDKNIFGASAVAIPGNVAGMQLAHENFSSLPWHDLVAPSVELASKGIEVDWYCQLILAAEAVNLSRFEYSAQTFLNKGYYPKSSAWTALDSARIHFDKLAQTLSLIASEGGDTFYRGALAKAMVSDLQAHGGCHDLKDFADYQAKLVTADQWQYRQHTIFTTPEFTAGSTCRKALDALAQSWRANSHCPDTQSYRYYHDVLRSAIDWRLKNMGDNDSPHESCTTHFNVVDRQGNMVSVTQTLLSIFGSRLMLPNTGILMNNGIMWFDPRPGRANSLANNKQCLSNMCPVLVESDKNIHYALGAAGGRRILPAVAQLISFLLDYDMDIAEAMRTPRLDVSHPELTLVDESLSQQVMQELSQQISKIKAAPRTIYPYNFACPSIVSYQHKQAAGITEIMSPWSHVCAAEYP